MLYALLGSGLLGALSTAFLLWRKSVVETTLAECRGERDFALDQANRALSELKARSETFEDQLARQREQVETLRGQRDKAIEMLAKSGAPGSITDLLRQTMSKGGNT